MNTTPKTLTVIECRQLLCALVIEAGTEKQSRRGIRNYTIALLMLDAGLRVGEVVRLMLFDLYFDSVPVTSIIISADIAKNNTERIIPVSQRLSDALKKLGTVFAHHLRNSAGVYVFHGANERQPLTTRQVERIIRSAAMKSIGRPIHPHMLRHTFATRLMRKANARVVQELLGHSSMTSTQIYTHPNQDDLKKAIDQLGQGEITTGLPPQGSAPY